MFTPAHFTLRNGVKEYARGVFKMGRQEQPIKEPFKTQRYVKRRLQNIWMSWFIERPAMPAMLGGSKKCGRAITVISVRLSAMWDGRDREIAPIASELTEDLARIREIYGFSQA